MADIYVSNCYLLPLLKGRTENGIWVASLYQHHCHLRKHYTIPYFFSKKINIHIHIGNKLCIRWQQESSFVFKANSVNLFLLWLLLKHRVMIYRRFPNKKCINIVSMSAGKQAGLPNCECCVPWELTG